MGCNSSSVVPLAESDIDESCGIKVRVNPSTPDQIKALPLKKGNTAVISSSDPPTETLQDLKSINTSNGTKPPPLAFEVPIFDDEIDGSLIKKHPPKRLRRLGDAISDTEELSHDVLDEKQREAEKRRIEILSQRVMSAKTRPRPKPLLHSDAFSQDSSESWERNM